MLILFTIAASLNLLLWAWVMGPWWKKENESSVEKWPSLSVVIAARNELENLKAFLPLLFALEYEGEWEIVLVLDRCKDGSEEWVGEMENERLRWVNIEATENGWAPKKWALSQGIAAARFESLVFTDADCRPEAGWLAGMGRAFSAGHDLVLGMGRYRRHPGLLNAFIRYETLVTGLLYGGLARRGRAYMGVGRNLGYTQALYASVGGFEAHKGRLSGDDDLFVNAVGRTARVAVLTTGETHTVSAPERTWPDWVRQKVRHLGAGTAYRISTQLFLAMFHGVHAIFYLSLLLVLWEPQDHKVIVGVITARSLILLLMGFIPFRKWKAGRLLIYFLMLDILYLFYNFLLVPLSLVSQPKWKG